MTSLIKKRLQLASLHLLMLWPSLAGAAGTVVFYTGLPDSPYPSIWGTHTATFTPLHDMTVDSALGTNTVGNAGRIVSLEFRLNGALIGQGTGGNFNVPALFGTPLTLHSGVAYDLKVDTFSYPQLFHVSQISTADAIISNIQFVDVNGAHSIAFPVMKLFGPIPEPSASVLLTAGIVALAGSRRRFCN